MEKDRINEIRDAVEKVGEEIKALQEKQGSLNRRELFLEINKLREVTQSRYQEIEEIEKELKRINESVRTIEESSCSLRYHLDSAASCKIVLKNTLKEIEELKKQNGLNDIAMNQLLSLEKKQKWAEKTWLEYMAFGATIILGSLPIFSLLGVLILYFYLNQLNLDAVFINVASDLGGLWFLIAGGIFLLITQFFIPICIFLFNDDYITGKHGKSRESKNSWGNLIKLRWLLLVFLYLVGFFLSLFGTWSLFDDFIIALVFALLWTVFNILGIRI